MERLFFHAGLRRPQDVVRTAGPATAATCFTQEGKVKNCSVSVTSSLVSEERGAGPPKVKTMVTF